MTSVLYYSNFCENSKEVIRLITSSNKQHEIYFVCIDKRITKGSVTKIMLSDNKTTMVLPPDVTKVPSLLLLNDSHKVLVGAEIIHHIKPSIRMDYVTNPLNVDTTEPECFDTNGKWCGVSSDTYSFWDQTDAELSAEGDGGMRQTRYYAGLLDDYRISTPEDTYDPDKVSQSDMETIKKNREDIYK